MVVLAHFEAQHHAAMFEGGILGGLEQKAADSLPSELQPNGDGIKPRHTAALAKQDDGIARDLAVTFADQRLGGLAFYELAKRATGNPVAGENGILDGGEVIDVGGAGLANLSRHAGLGKPRSGVKKPWLKRLRYQPKRQ